MELKDLVKGQLEKTSAEELIEKFNSLQTQFVVIPEENIDVYLEKKTKKELIELLKNQNYMNEDCNEVIHFYVEEKNSKTIYPITDGVGSYTTCVKQFIVPKLTKIYCEKVGDKIMQAIESYI